MPSPADSVFDLINEYYKQRPDFSQYIKEEEPQPNIQNLSLNEAKMPVHPAEENTSGNIFDQVAKDSSDSTASSHPAHQGDTGATSGGSVGATAHKGNLGPVVDQDIGKPESKETLKKRAAELNSK